jgi:hypothetical protein
VAVFFVGRGGRIEKKEERRKKKEESGKENFAIKASAHACVMPSRSKVKPPKVG